MNQLDKLNAEVEELEAQHNAQKLGDPEQSAATVEEVILPTQAEQDTTEFIETIVIPPAEEETIQPAPKPRENWKKRYTGYKASTDATIFEQRQELEQLRAYQAQTMEELQLLKNAKREVQGEDMFKDAFTESEVDTFGADGLDVVKKAAKVAIDSQVKPLKEQIAKAELDRVKSMKIASENERKASYERFTSSLGTLVPDFKELNSDPKFLEWIKQPDEHSGLPRISLLRRAEGTRDVKRTSDFFNDYKRTLVPVQTSPPEIEKYITPLGSGGQPPPQRQPDLPRYRQSDIDKFYSDIMKGRYKGQEKLIASTERAIELASMDKRIVYGQ